MNANDNVKIKINTIDRIERFQLFKNFRFIISFCENNRKNRPIRTNLFLINSKYMGLFSPRTLFT